MDDEAGVMVRRRPVKRLTALALLILVLLALLVAWTQRRPIASDFIDRELARRHVRATYEVKRIGFRTERLENLVIGDPRDPDLTARWVEVRLSWGLRRPRVSLITARGVRLHARLVGGGSASATSTGSYRRPRACRSACPTSVSTSPTPRSASTRPPAGSDWRWKVAATSPTASGGGWLPPPPGFALAAAAWTW